MSIQTVQMIQGKAMVVKPIDDHQIAISGKFPRIARIRSEPYQCLTSPEAFIGRLADEDLPADIFTFIQQIGDAAPKYEYYHEYEQYAVLAITTYDHWWKKQLDAKTRNMIRKAEKAGIQLQVVDFDDRLVNGIKDIYDETPVRQGKPFWHYRKDFETVKRDHETFLDVSTFIGAFHQGELIGFVKLVRSGNLASLMQIISKVAHRDKAPMNALVAKAVEICSREGIQYLHYGVWSKGGLGMFKTSHAFECHKVPRYFVPLTFRGRLALKMKLHRRLGEAIPEEWIKYLAPLRQKWNAARYKVQA